MNKCLRREFMDYTDDYNEEDYLDPEDFENELELRDYRRKLRNKFKKKRTNPDKSYLDKNIAYAKVESKRMTNRYHKRVRESFDNKFDIDKRVAELNTLFDEGQISSAEYDREFNKIYDFVAKEAVDRMPSKDDMLDEFLHGVIRKDPDDLPTVDEYRDFLKDEAREAVIEVANALNSKVIVDDFYLDEFAYAAYEEFEDQYGFISDDDIYDGFYDGSDADSDIYDEMDRFYTYGRNFW